MSPHDDAALFRFRLDRPDLDDIPDELLAGSFLFRTWVLGEALALLGRALRVEAQRIPLIGRLFR